MKVFLEALWELQLERKLKMLVKVSVKAGLERKHTGYVVVP